MALVRVRAGQSERLTQKSENFLGLLQLPSNPHCHSSRFLKGNRVGKEFCDQRPAKTHTTFPRHHITVRPASFLSATFRPLRSFEINVIR